MEPLVTNRRVMMWLCMCPAKESASKKQRIFYVAFAFTVTSITSLFLLSSIVFIVKYLSIDFELSLYALFQAAAEIAMVNLIFVAFSMQHQIGAIFTQLSKIYRANENKATFRFLMEANQKSEWIWNIYLKFVVGGVFTDMMVSTVISLLFCFYKYGHFDVSHMYIPCRLALPWNQQIPLGYAGDLAFSTAASVFYYVINGSFLLLVVSMCWHHKSFYDRFHHSVLQLNDLKNTSNAKEILRDLLHFHITVKDWFLQSAEACSPFILIQLICNMLQLAICIFQVDLRFKHLDFEITFILFVIFTEISNLFMFCYFGMLATESFENMAECLYESDWRNLPLDMQKDILLMIENMQKPVYYHGFGVAVLNLQTFIKFMRAVITYYMAFKTITRE